MKLTIAHLYPRELNIYGDYGNIQALTYRSQQRNIKVTVKQVGINDSLKPGSFDLLFSGGGQDRHQLIVAKDLQRKKRVLKKAVANNIPMLTICGSYQLFGHYFQPFKGKRLKGIKIFNAYTVASKVRKIGNVVINADWLEPSTLVGFENHSGNTFLNQKAQSLGTVQHGFGNNGQDQLEGARINNSLGCYLHGALLPKNPHLTDWLIKKALENKCTSVKLKPLTDNLEWTAHQKAISRTKKLSHPLLKWFK